MLVLLVVLLFFLFFFHRFLFVVGKLPPGPTIWQLWRRRSKFATNPHVALRELAKIYGPLMSLRIGGQLIVVASSPAIAKEIHKTNNHIFSGRYFPSVYYNTPGTMHASLVMARECDDTWKFLRSIGQNFIFSSKATELAAGIRKTDVMEMVELLRRGEVVNMEHVIFVTFTNIITNVLTSRNLFDTGGEGENDEKVVDFLSELIENAAVLGLTDVFPVLKGIDFWSKGKGMEMYRNIKHMWGDIIEERRARHNANPKSKQDFLDILIGYSFHDDQIRIVLTELLSAATESTSVTAAWLMAELIKNQEILRKVREEIADKAVEGDALNESLLSECRYFQACVKETLRLHIPGPFAVPHRAIKTCKVNSYTIPKDSIVLVNAWAIHMDPNIWEDATAFKPQRFLDSSIDFKGAHFEFIPFSAGKRMCPGSNVAIRGVQSVVASLVHYFDWSLPIGNDLAELDMNDKFGISLKMEKPFYLIPRTREN